MRAGFGPRSRPGRACDRAALHRQAGRVAVAHAASGGPVRPQASTGAARCASPDLVGLLGGDDLEDDRVSRAGREAKHLRSRGRRRERSLARPRERLPRGRRRGGGRCGRGVCCSSSAPDSRTDPRTGSLADSGFLAVRLHFVNGPLIRYPPSASILEHVTMARRVLIPLLALAPPSRDGDRCLGEAERALRRGQRHRAHQRKRAYDDRSPRRRDRIVGSGWVWVTDLPGGAETNIFVAGDEDSFQIDAQTTAYRGDNFAFVSSAASGACASGASTST